MEGVEVPRAGPSERKRGRKQGDGWMTGLGDQRDSPNPSPNKNIVHGLTIHCLLFSSVISYVMGALLVMSVNANG